MSWEETARAWVRLSAKYSKQIVIAGAIVVLLLTSLASGLRLDSNLASLLPENADSVVGLQDMESRYDDQVGRLTVFVNNVPAEQHKKVAEELAAALSPVEGVHRVVYRRPAELLKSRRLLYLETEDLEEISERLSKRIRWEKRKANPLFADLGTKKKPEIDLSDIEEKYDNSAGPYYRDETTGALLLFVHPSFPSLDLNQTRDFVDGVARTSREVLSPYPNATAELTGRYAKRVETQEILESDLELGTSIALVGLLLFLLLYFRSFTAVVLVLGPLMAGTIGAGAWAWLIFGKLNILTAFLGAILLGLGADFGIHMVSSYMHRRQTLSAEDAAINMLKTSGRAGTYASLTTATAFIAVAILSSRRSTNLGSLPQAVCCRSSSPSRSFFPHF